MRIKLYMLRFEKLKIRDMKDFALQLEGCSKADRKKVIKAAKSVGYKWYDNDRFMNGVVFLFLPVTLIKKFP